MEKIITVGLDLAKSIFQVHGIAENGKVLVRRTLRRSQVLPFEGSLLLGGDGGLCKCTSWAREIAALGHLVRMMPPAYVKPYVKRNKTDVADAEAICEAVTRPTMRFVPVKTAEQQAAGMILRTRELLMRQRSQTANALRAHMAELGIIAGTGMASIAKLLLFLRDEDDNRIPGAAQFALTQFAEQIEILTTRIEKLDKDFACRQEGPRCEAPDEHSGRRSSHRRYRSNIGLGSSGLCDRTRFCGLDGTNTEGTVERRERKARGDIKAGK